MVADISLLHCASYAREQLKTAFPGQVTGPDDPKYEDEVSRSWSVTSRTPAAAYVSLNSSEEVAEALRIVKRTGCKFAIRSAGHNANPGFSSVNSNGAGVVLDLHNLTSKALDKDANTARLGAGNNWSETFKWLEGEGLSAIGAREGRVGLSGFLLSGGQGIFSSLHGIGADGVKNLEVVLADGTIVNANAESHPDLYLALKGGGSNFGIVTNVSLQVHPLIKVQYTINLYDPSDYENILAAFAKVQEGMEHDHKVGMFINTRRDFVAVGLFYADWPEEFPAIFDPIMKLSSLIKAAIPTTNGTFSSISEVLEQWAYAEQNLKHAYLTMTTKISHELYEEGHKAWKDVVEKLPRSVDLHWSVQPLTQAAVKAGQDLGGNIMGLQNLPQSCWIFACDWAGNEEDEAVKLSLDTLLEKTEHLAASKGLLLDLRFPSFAGASQNVLGSFGEQNAKKLQEVAARYDPDGLFQEFQVGGFLLRNL